MEFQRIAKESISQLEREPPQLAYRFCRIHPRAQYEHRLREDVVVVEDLHRSCRVINAQPLLEVLQYFRRVALDADQDPTVAHVPQLGDDVS